MDGSSLLIATAWLALGASIFLDSTRRRFRRTQFALALVAIAAFGLSFLGYDLRVGWSLVEPAAIVASVILCLAAILRWEGTELGKGANDEPNQAL